MKLSRIDTNKLVRGFAFALEIYILHIIQSIPNFIPRIFTVTPLLTAAACVSIALLESELTGMLVGLEAGILLDITGSGPFGAFGMFFLVIFAFVSAFSRRKLKIKLSYLMTAAVPTLAMVFLSIWLVEIFMPMRSVYTDSLINHYLPMFIYTYLAVPFFYPINAFLHRKLRNSVI